MRRAKKFLEQVRKAPAMYATNKEAFCATVHTAIYVDGYAVSGSDFFMKHLRGRGREIEAAHESFDDAWAHAVVDDALSYYEREPLRDDKAEIERLSQVISDANDALFDSRAHDVEHSIECHADTLAVEFRHVAAGHEKALLILQAVIQEWVEG